MKIFAEVYGCTANLADYEIALGLLRQANFKIVKNLNNSNLNIIFTCTVKIPTLNRMIHRIKELTKLRKPLIVAGCMPKTERNLIEKINPRASMLGPNSIEKIVDVTNATMKGKKIVFLQDLRKPKVCMPRIRRNPVIGIIPIATGCLSNCSFCSVKFARGRLLSYPTNMIVEEANRAIKNGCKELYITSQDNSCYGKDINTNLAELLEKICEINGKFFVRVGMMNPVHTKDIIDELIESYKSEKIFKFLHLPVQSGSNKILKRMNRGYDIKDFKTIIKKFRKEFPILTLSTDIIVGFPEEKEKDFRQTMDLIKEVKPDIVNLSKFGARSKTEAEKMEKLPNKTIDERVKKINKIIEKIKIKNSKKWLNWEGEILIDEVGKKGGMIGRNFAYKPVLTSGKIGTFQMVRIIDARPTFLIGKRMIF